MRTNSVIPSEATHCSLDLFEKPPLLVTFVQSFEQNFIWRSSVEYFKQIERIYATQLVMLMPVIFHILLIASFIRFSPTILFLQMVSKFQQLMDTMHTKVS